MSNPDLKPLAIEAQAVADKLWKLVDHLGTDEEVTACAQQFAQWSDDAQAKFFVEVARIMTAGGYLDNQAHYAAKHLSECACSSREARDYIRLLARNIDGYRED